MEIHTILPLCLLMVSSGGNTSDPITWSYSSRKTSNTEATLFIKATLNDGWHIYSQTLPKGGPLRTNFAFSSSLSFTLLGNVIEPDPIIKYDEFFGLNIAYFEKEVVFQQKIKLKNERATVKGTIQFMLCNDRQCLPPQKTTFLISVE